MTTPQRAAIYARISQDRDDSQLAVSRQLADCRARAETLGWMVAEEYVDDDVSAFSGKERPGYRRMLEDLSEGRIDGLLAWHMDRLYRRPLDLEELIGVCGRVGVTQLDTLRHCPAPVAAACAPPRAQTDTAPAPSCVA